MSTRCSKYYANSLHLYWECNYQQLCLAWPEGASPGHKSSEYGDFCMSKENWIDMRRDKRQALSCAQWGTDE